jgi:2-polyprenyl-3-methyl-5-hydroxy-6-metoxy-1,4-benzoquinol methylase
MNEVMHFYDLIAEQEAQEWYPNNLLLPSIKEYLELFAIKPRILDLGCGTGHESMRLKNEGADVVGIDFSKESIKIAKEKNKDIPFYLMDYESINSSLGMFDGIFSSGSIIHLDEAHLKSLLLRLTANINKNGYMIVIFQKGEEQRKHYPVINGEKIERIVELYSKDKMTKIFEECGYKYVKEGYLDKVALERWMSIIFQKVI